MFICPFGDCRGSLRNALCVFLRDCADNEPEKEEPLNKNRLFTWEPLAGLAGEPEGIRILSVDPKEEYVILPERLEDLPVLELGPYALENSRIREIQLPSSLKRIGRYAFYNCGRLEKLRLYDGIKDVGTGAFTGVHRVQSIHLTMKEENGKQAVLQELLADFSETLEVTLVLPREEIRLLFPEYYEQGVENTPARIIVNQFFGTGLKYRNCFVNRQLQYEEYDRLFPLAVAGERPEMVQELALRRLRWPYRLKESSRQSYLEWIRSQADRVLTSLIEDRRLEELRFLLEEAQFSPEAKKQAALVCAETGFAAAVPLFMESSETAEEDTCTDSTGTESEEASSRQTAGFPEIVSSFDLDEI